MKAPKEFPEMSKLQLELSVVQKGIILTLWGIFSLPVAHHGYGDGQGHSHVSLIQVDSIMQK